MRTVEGDSFGDITTSRRVFISAAAGLIGYSAYQDHSAAISDLISGDRAEYVNPQEIGRGYSVMDKSHPIYPLIFSPEGFTPLEPETLQIGEGELLFKGEIRTTGYDTPVDLSIKSGAEDAVQFHPLIVKANGLNIFVPMVTSLQDVRISTQLGEFADPGIHEFEIYQVDGFPPLDPYHINPEFSIPQGTSIQNEMRQTSAIYGIRPNNLKGLEGYKINDPLYRKILRLMGDEDMQSVATDAPMIGYNKILVHESLQRIRRDSVIIFKSEKKGKDAHTRLSEYGRIEDVETAMMDIMNFKGDVLQPYYQGSNHRTAKSKSSHWRRHPLLQIKTDNNNFDDQMETDLVFMPVPSYLPEDLDSKQIIRANPALRYLAFMGEAEKPSSSLKDGEGLANNTLDLMRSIEVEVYPAFPLLGS